MICATNDDMSTKHRERNAAVWFPVAFDAKGLADSNAVGETVGLFDGAELTSGRDGAFECDVVGFKLGDALGGDDGSPDGSIVGSPDGFTEGDVDGCDVGRADGATDGRRVGTALGASDTAHSMLHAQGQFLMSSAISLLS